MKAYTFSFEPRDGTLGPCFAVREDEIELARKQLIDICGTDALMDSALVIFANPEIAEFETVDAHGNIVHISVDELPLR